MKHLEVRQKYSAARRIFNSLLGVSSSDATLRLMLDILLPNLRFCLWSTPLKAKPYSTFLYCYQTILFLCIKSVIVCYIYASHSGPLRFKLFVSPLTGTLKWVTRAPKMLLSCFLFLILLEMLAKQLLLESVVQSLVFNLMIFTR